MRNFLIGGMTGLAVGALLIVAFAPEGGRRPPVRPGHPAGPPVARERPETDGGEPRRGMPETPRGAPDAADPGSGTASPPGEEEPSAADPPLAPGLAEVLGRIGAGGPHPEFSRELSAVLQETRRRSGGQLTLDVLRPLLESEVDWVRRTGVGWCSSVVPAPVEILRRVGLTDPSERVRATAVLTLAHAAGKLPEVRETVVAALSDPSPRIRAYAVYGLADLSDGHPERAIPLLDLFDDPDPNVRRNAIDRAADLGVPGMADRAVAALVEGRYDGRTLGPWATAVIRAGRTRDVLGSDPPKGLSGNQCVRCTEGSDAPVQ